MSNEKVSTLKALGAEIVRTPVNLDSFADEGMFGITHKLHKEIPNSVILDQVKIDCSNFLSMVNMEMYYSIPTLEIL